MQILPKLYDILRHIDRLTVYKCKFCAYMVILLKPLNIQELLTHSSRLFIQIFRQYSKSECKYLAVTVSGVSNAMHPAFHGTSMLLHARDMV